MVIGKRKRPKPQPRPAAPFQSALGDLAILCPTCRGHSPAGGAGDAGENRRGPYRDGRVPLDLTVNLWPCEYCDGVFVETAAFEAMVEDMAHAPYHLPEPSGAPGPRECPACERPMLTELIGSTPIDRCPQHGIWFDESELAEALQSAVPPPGGIGAWLKRVFFAFST